MTYERIINRHIYVLKNETNMFLYNSNRWGGGNARIASHSIALSVLAFSTISHDWMRLPEALGRCYLLKDNKQVLVR